MSEWVEGWMSIKEEVGSWKLEEAGVAARRLFNRFLHSLRSVEMTMVGFVRSR